MKFKVWGVWYLAFGASIHITGPMRTQYITYFVQFRMCSMFADRTQSKLFICHHNTIVSHSTTIHLSFAYSIQVLVRRRNANPHSNSYNITATNERIYPIKFTLRHLHNNQKSYWKPLCFAFGYCEWFYFFFFFLLSFILFILWPFLLSWCVCTVYTCTPSKHKNNQPNNRHITWKQQKRNIKLFEMPKA